MAAGNVLTPEQHKVVDEVHRLFAVEADRRVVGMPLLHVAFGYEMETYRHLVCVRARMEGGRSEYQAVVEMGGPELPAAVGGLAAKLWPNVAPAGGGS